MEFVSKRYVPSPICFARGPNDSSENIIFIFKRLLQNRIFDGGQIATDSGLPSESRHDGG